MVTSKKIKKTANQTIIYAVLIIGMILILYPFIWTLFTSFKTNYEIYTDPWGLPTTLRWENYVTAMDVGSLPTALRNSTIITISSVAILALISPPAAYVLAKPYRWTKIFFYAYISGMFIAPTVFIIPLYSLLNTLNLADTYFGLILVYVSGGLPYCLIIQRAAFLGIPRSLENSARVDGLSMFQTFRKILLPLVMPAVLTSLIVEGIWMWNDFFYPLILVRSRDMFTLPLALAVLKGHYAIRLGPLAAGIFIAALPVMVLYIIFADLIRRGVAGGIGVRGAGRA